MNKRQMTSAVEIIEKKKLGKTLDTNEINRFVKNYMAGLVRDYQMSAFLMAVYFKGMNERETADLTEVMFSSGDKLDLTDVVQPKVDKHSTGGVGDKVSIALAPLAASLGVKVPMLSGRALGHTGGTLDKLESIQGFKSKLDKTSMRRMIEQVGCFISGQTAEIAPADKSLYALRDVTGTVDCIPLITSSILSKKLAEGIDSLVMDVKFGSGAFMKPLPQAKALARSLKHTGEKLGLKVRAILTSVEEPLGYAVGNSLEIIEAVQLLEGKGARDLDEVTKVLAAHMLVLGGISGELEEAIEIVSGEIESGRALKKFREWIKCQGGKLDYGRTDFGLDVAEKAREFRASRSGYIAAMDAREIGWALVDIGGGRSTMEDTIDHGVGFVFSKKVGDQVASGETIALMYGRSSSAMDAAEKRLCSSVKISLRKVPPCMKFAGEVD